MDHPLSLYVAVALSMANKAITTLAHGTRIVVERDFTGERYNYILIDEEFRQSTTIHGMSKSELWDILKGQGITNSRSVWFPVAPAPSVSLLMEQVPFHILSDQLLPLAGDNACPVCGEEGPVYTHNILHAHACRDCWHVWHRINRENRGS